jgi:hypothetical protein
MKGKILNVRGELTAKISQNKEITEIKQILGLKIGKQYTAEDALKTLRYGKVLFMTDQDLDGSHNEIDGMNNGDKGGINTLIKLIRPTKNKKQKLEEVTMNPIICIGNYHIDKKIKELMKVYEKRAGQTSIGIQGDRQLSLRSMRGQN